MRISQLRKCQREGPQANQVRVLNYFDQININLIKKYYPKKAINVPVYEERLEGNVKKLVAFVIDEESAS